MIKKNILLTGASGTVGFEALLQLIDKKKYNVTVFDKKTKQSSLKLLPYKDQINLIFGDIAVEKDLETVKNIDVAIHLAAVIPPFADDFPAIAKKVNLIGTQNLVNQLEKYSPNSFLMYSSSISVYGDRLFKPFIKVSDVLKPSEGDYYATTKISAEEYIEKSKLDYTIFRLAAIMGNHKLSKLMFHQPLDTSLEIATPRDTARAFVNGIEKQNELSKRIFNLGGGEKCRVSYEDFLKRSFTVFGLGKLNFPKHAFADKNFHCGYYADGDALEKIVQFRQNTIDNYFEMEAKKVSSFQKFITSAFKTPIKWFLLKKSEPYQAYNDKDIARINHYFN